MANLRLIRAGGSLGSALRGNVGQREDALWTGTKEWVAFIGRRNIAYVIFVSLLVSFGMLMESAGP